jgi:hypothetical protein
MLAASHLEPIYRALGRPVEVRWVELTQGGKLPAVYDVRLQGLPAAMRSILDVRRAIRKNVAKDEVLVVEELGARERAMTWPRPCEQIGRTAPNIYCSYARHFASEAGGIRVGDDPKQVAIFPDARLPHRVLPDHLLVSIRDECAARGLKVKAVRVGKGTSNSGPDGIPVEWIDGFDALVSAIRSADIAVSSDSLPGHIAEYFGVPVFVFVPQRKDFWMPGSAFETRGFAMYSDPGALGNWLETYGVRSLASSGKSPGPRTL